MIWVILHEWFCCFIFLFYIMWYNIICIYRCKNKDYNLVNKHIKKRVIKRKYNIIVYPQLAIDLYLEREWKIKLLILAHQHIFSLQNFNTISTYWILELIKCVIFPNNYSIFTNLYQLILSKKKKKLLIQKLILKNSIVS